MQGNEIVMTKMMAQALMVGLALTVGAGVAQAAQPIRTRGVVTAIKGDELDVTSRTGKVVAYHLTTKTRVAGMTVAKITDIQPGSFVGTAAVPLPDGRLKALEVHVFPPSMRGAGEGHRPWDQGRGSSMTNGTVGKLIVSNGDTLTITYKGGQKIVVVPPDVPIVSIVPGDRTLLKLGAHVSTAGVPGTDGLLDAVNVAVGLNGLVPPT
jgi:endonuclease YncB( thermonuclease family)